MTADIPWSSKCKEIILDFANNSKSVEAIQKLQEHVGAEVVIPPPQSTEVRRERSRLRKLLAELSTAQTLNDCDSLEEYLTAYNFRIKPFLGLQADGEIGESPVDFGKEIAFDDLLTYCVITFLREPKNRLLVYKCENKECWNYHIKKTKRKSRFCSDECRYQDSNRRRIDSGEHREYKARKKLEVGGAKPSYHGPDPEKKKRRIDSGETGENTR